MKSEIGSQPTWQRLGEYDLQEWDSDIARANVRSALMQSVAGFVAFDEMQTPLESAIIDAIERKTHAKPGCQGQRLVISCLNPPDGKTGQAQSAAGWSFFVIERPAASSGGSAIEVIELCLYHE